MQMFHKHHQEMHLLLLEISVMKAGERVRNENSSKGAKEWVRLLSFITHTGKLHLTDQILINPSPKQLKLITWNRPRQRKGTRMQMFHKHHQEMNLLL